jgi:hypothetical protein
MRFIIVFLMFICCLLSQQYLPKEGDLPINDLLSNNIARAGDNDFWKVDEAGGSVLLSAYPLRPGVITKVTFYFVYGNDFHIGIGKGDFSKIPRNYVGGFPNSISFHCISG